MLLGGRDSGGWQGIEADIVQRATARQHGGRALIACPTGILQIGGAIGHSGQAKHARLGDDLVGKMPDFQVADPGLSEELELQLEILQIGAHPHRRQQALHSGQ